MGGYKNGKEEKDSDNRHNKRYRSFKADKTTAAVGEAITWTGATTGGTGTLQTGFRIYRDGTLVMKGSYGTSKTVTYTPTEAGTYTAKFYVKDSAGTVVTKTSSGVNVTW